MFKILEKRGNRRYGVLSTLHGDIYTPAFGPDATRGLIKNLAPNEILDLSGRYSPFEILRLLASHDTKHDLFNNKIRRQYDEIQFILSNTYHLMSYPGDEFIKERGGLHDFILWPLPILTDSGGFQVFSLIHKAQGLKGKVTDNGAIFQNPITGQRLELTPESAIDIQFNLGSDIMVVLDDCRHYQDQKELKKSVYRTIEWAKRCKIRFEQIIKEKFNNLNTHSNSQAHLDGASDMESQKVNRPLLFAVVQGGIDYSLREYCVQELTKIGFDGYGFGGWAINEKEYFPYDLLKFVAERLPEDKPRYAMGVGTPANIIQCLDFGYDLFDCVIPSRNARHGLAYTTQGEVRIQNAKYKRDKSPLDPDLPSIASNYKKEYIHHLFKIRDSLGGELLTIQNLKYFNYILNNF
ncbi:MAG: queuine tRNA-ribosyltransferase [Candidatus Dojkabacteria bacterium]|nr:MAG: queuine tRNA-ribosyltransferase [Candidatus Dojkabacteria bacterium]